MISILKQITKSALMSMPLGRDYFDRVQIIRSQNMQMTKELELTRQSLVSPKVLEVKLDTSRAHILGLEDEVRRLSAQIGELKAISLRDKRQSLQLLAQKGFAPDLIVDVGAAGATVGLYDTWPSAHYLLIEPLEKYRTPLLEVCAGLVSAEVVTAAVGATSGELKLAAHPTGTTLAFIARQGST